MDRNHRRRFGQNFLDPSMARAIANDLEAPANTSILEIGPGQGALTTHLLERGFLVTAVEIDPECTALLQEKFSQAPLQVLCQDVLAFDLATWLAGHPNAWIVGNLPYNVATAIITKILPHLKECQGLMAMVQYEVAERLCASPRQNGYGSLSVFVRSHAETRILRKVAPEYFTPRPNVDSATFLMRPLENPPALPADFETFVHAAFAQKRKQLANPLSALYPKDQVRAAIEACGFPATVRAEELDVADFVKLRAELRVES